MIKIEEQGLRDGIQNLDYVLPTEVKVDYIHRLVDAGLSRIQIASFVHPRLVPQMADAEEVCKLVQRKDDVIYSGLVLNERGVERGVAAGLSHLACSISASNTHSMKNAGKNLAEARAAFAKMVAMCKSSGVMARGGIQCAFGCRFEGEIAQEHVMDMVKSHLDSGIDELALADSTGMGNPMQVEEMMAKVLAEAGEVPVILHLHNTENKGYANVYAAIRVGVRIFDTAFGGLGGCPFIENATGNVATEDVVHMLEQMGMETGVDIGKVAEVSREMAGRLGDELPGRMYGLVGNEKLEMNNE